MQKVKNKKKNINNKNNDELINENYNNKPQEKLFKIFISIFFYEKYYKEYNSLSSHDYYYLINPDWMNKFKENYNYQELYKSLSIYSQKNSKINYSKLNAYIDNIIKYYINENVFNFTTLEFNQDLLNIPIVNNLKKYYIIDS